MLLNASLKELPCQEDGIPWEQVGPFFLLTLAQPAKEIGCLLLSLLRNDLSL